MPETMAKSYPRASTGAAIIKEFTGMYRLAQESTSSSPKGQHIGHYKAALKIRG
jgi:hypothetical protein